MEWYEAEVRALVQHVKEASLPPQPAVFYGSSTIRLWTDLATDLDDPRALNLGFGGSTLAACVHFFERLVPPVHPASLVVYAGDNDLGDGRSPEDVFTSFRALAALVEKWLPAIPFGFISVKLSPARVGLRDRIVRTNELIRQAIQQHAQQAYYIDLYEAMLSADGQPRPELFLADGLHLSPTGYQLWARLLQPFRHQIFTPLLPLASPDGLPSAISES